MAEMSDDTTWEEDFRRWSEARRAGRWEEVGRWLDAARTRIARDTAAAGPSLTEALEDAERKWFVAEVFGAHPVPKTLFGPMLRAAVLERDPSFNRAFVEPCVASFGARRVLEELLRYLESGTDAEKAGAASALYWAGDNPRHEDVSGLRERIRCRMLREFVDNPHLDVRQRIIPMLRLEPEGYPEALRPLVAVAVQIARFHPDAYIRHRVEVQLGAGGPLMALPDGGAGQP